MVYKFNPFSGTLDYTEEIDVPISVTNGGTGTSTAFTQGSILFANVTGVYTQDNAGIKYVDSTNSLVMGRLTITPGALDGLNILNTEEGKDTTIRNAFSTNASLAGGGFYLQAGLNTQNSGVGGGFSLIAGQATGTGGTGGNLVMNAGDSGIGAGGGEFQLYAGAGGSQGGGFTINAGPGQDAGSVGGSFSMQGGDSTGATGTGGTFYMFGGNCYETDGRGGDFQAFGGIGEVHGGNALLAGGGGAGTGNGVGGDVYLYAGLGDTGQVGGKVELYSAIAGGTPVITIHDDMTNSLLGFFQATPVAKPSSTYDLKQSLVDYGLITGGGATPLNLGGGAATLGATTTTTLSISAGAIISGTYTPTLTNVANLSASTAYSCQYIRVGANVTVSGRIDIDPTTTATLTQLGLTLPIASNLANSNECAGTAFASGIIGQGAAILGDATNNRAQLQYIAGDVTNQAMYFSFTYRII